MCIDIESLPVMDSESPCRGHYGIHKGFPSCFPGNRPIILQRTVMQKKEAKGRTHTWLTKSLSNTTEQLSAARLISVAPNEIQYSPQLVWSCIVTNFCVVGGTHFWEEPREVSTETNLGPRISSRSLFGDISTQMASWTGRWINSHSSSWQRRRPTGREITHLRDL